MRGAGWGSALSLTSIDRTLEYYTVLCSSHALAYLMWSRLEAAYWKRKHARLLALGALLFYFMKSSPTGRPWEELQITPRSSEISAPTRTPEPELKQYAQSRVSRQNP